MSLVGKLGVSDAAGMQRDSDDGLMRKLLIGCGLFMLVALLLLQQTLWLYLSWLQHPRAW